MDQSLGLLGIILAKWFWVTFQRMQLNGGWSNIKWNKVDLVDGGMLQHERVTITYSDASK